MSHNFPLNERKNKMEKKITTQNFMKSTNANFTPCVKPEREPDFTSPSGSQYWYENGGVIRHSDHWGAEIASCNWFLDGNHSAYGASYTTGFCPLGDFIARDEMPADWHEQIRKAEAYGRFCNRVYKLGSRERNSAWTAMYAVMTSPRVWNDALFAPMPDLDLSIYA